MIAAFVLEGSSLLAFAGVVAAGMLVFLALRGPAADAGPGAKAAPAPRPRQTLIFVTIMLVGLLLLLAARTPLADALLLAVVALGAVRLSSELYARGGAALSPRNRARCRSARCVAWLALLLIIARPDWGWTDTLWEKPVAVIVADQSQSMSIVDPGLTASRAVRANRALAAARDELARLHELYDVRVLHLTDAPHAAEDALIQPAAPLTPLARALRQAAQARATDSTAPAAIILISDGAENAAEPQAVREAASELAAQRTALLAAGAGLPPGKAPSLALEPLHLPARISPRDRLQAPIAVRALGCDGRAVRLDALWNDNARADSVELRAAQGDALLRHEFSLAPPGAGVHTLTIRATLPAELGGGVAERSTIIDVRDERIRVLWLGAGPRQEFAFAQRALRGDARFEIESLFLPADRNADAERALPAWEQFDVVILDDVPGPRIERAAIDALADALTSAGVGLLLAGGAELFHQGYFSESALRDLAPMEFVRAAPKDAPVRFVPTEEGLRHAVLIAPPDSPATPPGDDAARWKNLPPLLGGVRLGAPKPLAIVLAADEAGHPLLVAHDAGRGRCAALGWGGSWPIALGSDDGFAAHRRLWRQLIAWLANRKPTPWLSVDQPRYAAAALQRGQQKVAIRAGVAGIPDEAWRRRIAAAKFTLELRRRPATTQSAPTTAPAALTPSWTIPLHQRGEDALAELPRDLATADWLAAGEFELSLNIALPPPASRPAAPAADEPPLTARTAFRVESIELEFREPTANLELLREAAQRTAEHGGRFAQIDELPSLIHDLAARDRRQRIERAQRYGLVERHAAWLWLIAAAALCVEWALRRRAGMA